MSLPRRCEQCHHETSGFLRMTKRLDGVLVQAILSVLEKHAAPFRKLTPEDLVRQVAGLNEVQKVVGWFQARQRFCPVEQTTYGYESVHARPGMGPLPRDYRHLRAITRGCTRQPEGC